MTSAIGEGEVARVWFTSVARAHQREANEVRLGLDRDVVMPDSGGRQALSPEARKSLRGVGLRHEASTRQSQPLGDLMVSIEPDDAIQEKACPHRQLPGGDRTIERQDERKRAKGLWRDPGEGGTLANRFTRTLEVERLQVAETSVNGPEVVEGDAGAKIVRLDERDRQTPLRRVVRDHQPVDAATDDEDIECASDEAIEIADHEDAR